MTWKEVNLGDISKNIQTGPFGSQLHQSDYSVHGTPVVMPQNIIDGVISESGIARVSGSHVKRLSRHKIEVGDILYARRGDIGRCALATQKNKGWLCGTGCLKVTVDKNIADAKFVFYQLQLHKVIGWVINHAVGSTMLNLNTNILQSIPLKIPDLTIQKKIVSILSAYDDLIENHRRQIRLLEEGAERLYKEWFVKFHYPGTNANYSKENLPVGWKFNKIKDVCKQISSGGTPSRKMQSYWSNGNIKWYKTGELQDTWLLNSSEHITANGLEHSAAKLFPKNSIAMAIYASPTLGRLGILSSEAACNQAMLFFIVNNELVTFQWLFFKLFELRDHFNSIAKGAGQQNISADLVKNTVICVPPIGLIHKFTDICRPIFEECLSLELKISKLQEARDRLLPKLMSGEVKV